MISKFVSIIVDYLKTKSFWHLIEPVFTLLSLYVVAGVIAYQYIQWRYHFTPELGVFLHSYLVKQITVVFITAALLALLFAAKWKAGVRTEIFAGFRGWLRTATYRIIIAGLVVCVAAGLFLKFSPNRVNHIKVKFLENPVSFDPYAFAYIVYELNRVQTEWHFTLDADVYNRNARSSVEEAHCGDNWLCDSEQLAQKQPFIGIIESGFADDHFWQNLGDVSVISAGQWKPYAPPSIYEYLAYSLIVQSTLIHLNRSCTGIPRGAFESSRVSYGDLFEFAPRRNQMKAAILAAHLSPQGQEMLANCFGLEYMNNCNRLLSLDWLRSGRVNDDLKKYFKIDL